MESLIFPHVGNFYIKKPRDSNIKISEILSSSQDSKLIQLTNPTLEQSKKSYPIILKIEGLFSSLFTKNILNLSYPKHIQSSSKPSTIFLIGDTDFLFNSFSYKQEQGQKKEKISNNIDFLTGIIEKSLEGKTLNSLRSKIQIEKKLDRLLEKKNFYKNKTLKSKNFIIEKINILKMKKKNLELKKQHIFVLNEQEQVNLKNITQEIQKKYAEIKDLDKKSQEKYKSYKNSIFLTNLLIVPFLFFSIFFLKNFTRKK